MLKLALDQNFPVGVVTALTQQLPTNVQISSLGRIDYRLTDLDDRELLLALSLKGWDGLVTNNYKMLNIPTELAAIIATRCIFVALRGMGQNALQSTGAFLLELPNVLARARIPARKPLIFDIGLRQLPPKEAWDYMHKIASRHNTEANALHAEHRVTESEWSQARNDWLP
jgi:hypothetical protein